MTTEYPTLSKGQAQAMPVGTIYRDPAITRPEYLYSTVCEDNPMVRGNITATNLVANTQAQPQYKPRPPTARQAFMTLDPRELLESVANDPAHPDQWLAVFFLDKCYRKQAAKAQQEDPTDAEIEAFERENERRAQLSIQAFDAFTATHGRFATLLPPKAQHEDVTVAYDRAMKVLF